MVSQPDPCKLASTLPTWDPIPTILLFSSSPTPSSALEVEKQFQRRLLQAMDTAVANSPTRTLTTFLTPISDQRRSSYKLQSLFSGSQPSPRNQSTAWPTKPCADWVPEFFARQNLRNRIGMRRTLTRRSQSVRRRSHFDVSSKFESTLAISTYRQ